MKKKIFKPKILLFIALSILIFAGVVFAINTISTGYRLNKNTFMVINAWSACRAVENTGSTYDYFVPTKTSSEWTNFINNKPGDVTITYCSQHPPRIAYFPGKVNHHTDSNGAWANDPDCSSGSGIDKLVYCRKWNSETISYAAYKMETITTWTDAGCVNLYTSTRQSYECNLCSKYGSSSTCTSAGCRWHVYGYACSRFACSSYGSSDCVAMGCYWDGYNCLEVPSCEWYYDEYDCDNDADCEYDNNNYCCYNFWEYHYPCSDYYEQWECENDWECQWDSDAWQCHEACY